MTIDINFYNVLVGFYIQNRTFRKTKQINKHNLHNWNKLLRKGKIINANKFNVIKKNCKKQIQDAIKNLKGANKDV